MRFPSIKSVASVLRDVQAELRSYPLEGDGVDVRLQVYPSGDWDIHVGDAQYDIDHRGYWGTSFLPYKRANIRAIAWDLIAQAKDEYTEGLED